MVSPLRARSEALALCHDDGRSATCWLGSPRGAVSGPAPELLYAIDHRVQPAKGISIARYRERPQAGTCEHPELKINDDEIDFVPVSTPDRFHGQVTRINVDLWEGSHRTKAALQELAARAATAFQRVTGSDRKVKVVIRPYDVEGAGWVSR